MVQIYPRNNQLPVFTHTEHKHMPLRLFQATIRHAAILLYTFIFVNTIQLVNKHRNPLTLDLIKQPLGRTLFTVYRLTTIRFKYLLMYKGVCVLIVASITLLILVCDMFCINETYMRGWLQSDWVLATGNR